MLEGVVSRNTWKNAGYRYWLFTIPNIFFNNHITLGSLKHGILWPIKPLVTLLVQNLTAKDMQKLSVGGNYLIKIKRRAKLQQEKQSPLKFCNHYRCICYGNCFMLFTDGKWLQSRQIVCTLTHYQRTNFRLFQTERVCRRQFQIWRKWKKVIQMGRKHCGKRRNCSLRAISPFPTVFSKSLFPRGVKRCHCVGIG